MDVWIPGIPKMLGLPRDVMLSGISVPAVRKAMEEHLLPNLALRLAVKGMSLKRRTEFVAGRICADQSLREMGIIAEFPLPVRNRLPVWPHGVSGSISHCSTMAVAMTAIKSGYSALGVDVEPLIDPGIALEIQESVCRSDELAGLERHMPCRMRSLTMLFSAKEALYKALFPLASQFEDFHFAEFCACEAGFLMLRLTHDWTSCWRAGTKMKIHYAWLGQMVISAVCMPKKP